MLFFLRNGIKFRIYIINVLFVIGIIQLSNAVFANTDSTDTIKFPSKTERVELTVNKPDSLTDFRAYKSNYILPVTYNDTLLDRQEKEVKFQFSFKQELFEINKFYWFLAYTQKSFWQAYDSDNSRPFRETNYNPELFVRSPAFVNTFGQTSLILGMEHESNGMEEPYSRSWNRFYFKLSHLISIFSIDLKTWYRIPESEKKYSGDPRGDENPYINKYYGFSELTIGFNIGGFFFETFGRYNPEEENGAIQIDITYPVFDRQMSWYCQYWNGYGESLIDYDKTFTKIGFGLMFTR